MDRPGENVVPFRKPRRWTRGSDYGADDRPAAWRRVSPIMIMLPLAAFTAVFVWPQSRQASSFETPIDRETASFALCDELAGTGYGRDNCVIDGDTFWYGGQKVRIADINTPEVSAPECAREAELGAAATERLHALLNEGPFTLEEIDRDRDRYGRLLRTVTRDGESLGAVLVDEGLAEEWRGYRGSWC